MSEKRGFYRTEDVLDALETDAFDDLYLSEFEDSDGDEQMTTDIIIDNDIRVNIADPTQGFTGSARRIDPCYHDSVLLDDVDLQNDYSDSEPDDVEVQNDCPDNSDEDDNVGPSTSSEQVCPSKSRKQRVGCKKRKQQQRTAPKGKKKQIRPKEPVWKSSFSQKELPKFDFLEEPGPARTVRGCVTPLDCFSLFFTSTIWNILVEQTNLYYRQSAAAKPSPMPWNDVDLKEIQAFIGLIIAMGVVRMLELDDYWSTDVLLGNPWFRSVMSRDRFKQILRYLHCTDNSTARTTDDKLYKIRPLIDSLNNSFRKVYVPTQCLSVDELMVGTKCRISFLQYMPKKPKKFGIKLWALCESVSGYCLQFQVYTGKVDTGVEHGLAYRVVFDLMAHYLNKGYKLFMDNFYSSYQLYVDLLNCRTGACGTVRPNRYGFPSELKAKSKMKD